MAEKELPNARKRAAGPPLGSQLVGPADTNTYQQSALLDDLGRLAPMFAAARFARKIFSFQPLTAKSA
ncbi:MAG TPA: hypothetical protein VKY65_05745 [Alphaproteobacteria bacterium]|nr:hypothetical protein [Alphaproteobacteria bacterium]